MDYHKGSPVNTLDIALHGALGASPDSDTRDALHVASIVCAEIAAGSDIADACAAAVVSPARYLASVEDRTDVRELHAKALRIRAALLADAPLALSRVLRDRREGRGASLGVTLGELAKAVMAEATLLAKAAGAGDTEEARAPTIVVRFDALPSHLPAPIPFAAIEYAETVTLSDSAGQADSALTDGASYTYDDDDDDSGGV